MSEDLINIDAASLISTSTSSIYIGIMWVLALLLISLIIFGFFWFMSYKHKVRIRKVVGNGKSIIIDDLAREVKGENGLVWWKLLKSNLKIMPPPTEAVDIGKKGKTYAEAYWLDKERFIWKNNDFNIKDFQDEQKIYVDQGVNAVFTDQERSLYMAEVKEAETYKKKKLGELLVAAAPYITIIIIFTLFLIFFNDVVQPSVEMAQLIRESSSEFKEAMSLLRDVLQNRETLPISAGGVPN